MNQYLKALTKHFSRLQLPYWLKLRWPDYTILCGVALLILTGAIPVPNDNPEHPVTSLIFGMIVVGAITILRWIAIIVISIGFLSTGWQIIKDIRNNNTPVLIYFIIEMMIVYRYLFPIDHL